MDYMTYYALTVLVGVTAFVATASYLRWRWMTPEERERDRREPKEPWP